MGRSTLFWRRIDAPGMERLSLQVTDEAVLASGTVICSDEGGYRIDHRWRLDREWRAQAVTVERWNDAGHGTLRLERLGGGWRVDGVARPDLDGAEEPDLSVTPFCNSLPIRRLGDSMTLETAYIDGPALTVTRSRQRYERLGPDRVRYVDLGVAEGFTAELLVDAEGLVIRYQHLFERVG